MYVGWGRQEKVGGEDREKGGGGGDRRTGGGGCYYTATTEQPLHSPTGLSQSSSGPRGGQACVGSPFYTLEGVHAGAQGTAIRHSSLE